MRFRVFFRYFVCVLVGAVIGYGLYVFAGGPETARAIVSNPVSSVGFMMFVGWLTALGFREKRALEDGDKGHKSG